MQHPFVAYHLRNPPHKNVVIDLIEKFGDVKIHHPILPFLRVLLCGSHGILCAAPRSESVAVLAEHRIEDGCQHLQQHLLNPPVLYRWNS
jgi:hypothetical protein